MADNFLENRMEEHRRQQASANLKPRHTVSSRTNSSSAPRPGRLVVDFPVPMRVLVIADVFGPELEAIVRRYRSIDAKVDFTTPESRQSVMLAQSCGARFIPRSSSCVAITDIIETCRTFRKELDVVVAVGSDLDVIKIGPETGIAVGVCHPFEPWIKIDCQPTPEATALLVVTLSHPIFRNRPE